MASTPHSLWDRYRNNALTNTKILVQAGARAIAGWIVNNPNATEAFVQMFNKAATGDVTLGTTVCDIPIKVGANSSVVIKADTVPLDQFELGLVIAATTTEGGSAAPVSALSIVLWYK